MIERHKIVKICYGYYNPISIYYHFKGGTYRDSFIKLRQNGIINYLDL
jgi:hypothetical protein